MWSPQTPKGKRAIVGLSGGVDSAVSAALLQKEGYDVVGVFIRIALPGYPCSAGNDKVDAMRVAAHLKIPFYEIDLSFHYKDFVFAETMKEYAKGRTPNPDALCNREIKFGYFYQFAMDEGADVVATGHYAQVREKGTETHLYAGKDPQKDQSYFLWAVPETALSSVRFPVGGLEKTQVRVLAKKFALPNAERKDSQGLCFLGDLSIDEMLHTELKPTPGEVLNEKGEAIGTHDGAVLYTLGQRHGFTLTQKNSSSVPHYVIAKDKEFNTVTVSADKFPKHGSLTSITLTEENWIGAFFPGKAKARFRYRQELIEAEILSTNEVRLLTPHYVPEGQSLVMYRNEQCLGGGIVEKSTLIS
jgi:tRNA-specific 2-thiouridylase